MKKTGKRLIVLIIIVSFLIMNIPINRVMATAERAESYFQISLVDGSKSTSKQKGDVNLDGIISSRDMAFAKKVALKKLDWEETDQRYINANYCEDNKVDGIDFGAIKRVVLGKDRIASMNTYKVGDEITLKTYSGTEYGGQNVSGSTWETVPTDSQVATVDSNGKVTFLANGKVTIKATSANGEYYDEIILYVSEQLDSAFQISLIDGSKSTSKQKGDVNLDGIISSRDMAFAKKVALKKLDWEETDQRYINANYCEDNKVDGIDFGAIKRVVLGKDRIAGMNTYQVGDEITLKTYLGTTEYGGEVETGSIWQTSNNNIATVDEDGRVTFEENGTVTITATSANGEYYDQIILYVSEQSDSVFQISLVDGSKSTSTQKGDVNLDGIISKRDEFFVKKIVNNEVDWEETDQRYINANYDGNNIVSALDISKIKGVAEGINIIPGVNTFKVGDEITLKTYSGTEYGGEVETGSIWQTSNDDIATVDSNGKVTFEENGTVTIVATSADGNYYDIVYLYVVGGKIGLKSSNDRNIAIENKDIYVKLDAKDSQTESVVEQLYAKLDLSYIEDEDVDYYVKGYDEETGTYKRIADTDRISTGKFVTVVNGVETEYNLYVMGDVLQDDNHRIDIRDVEALRKMAAGLDPSIEGFETEEKTSDVNGSNIVNGVRNKGDLNDVLETRKRITDREWMNPMLPEEPKEWTLTGNDEEVNIGDLIKPSAEGLENEYFYVIGEDNNTYTLLARRYLKQSSTTYAQLGDNETDTVCRAFIDGPKTPGAADEICTYAGSNIKEIVDNYANNKLSQLTLEDVEIEEGGNSVSGVKGRLLWKNEATGLNSNILYIDDSFNGVPAYWLGTTSIDSDGHCTVYYVNNYETEINGMVTIHTSFWGDSYASWVHIRPVIKISKSNI